MRTSYAPIIGELRALRMIKTFQTDRDVIQASVKPPAIRAIYFSTESNRKRKLDLVLILNSLVLAQVVGVLYF